MRELSVVVLLALSGCTVAQTALVQPTHASRAACGVDDCGKQPK